MGRYLEIARRVIEEQDRRKGIQPVAPERAPVTIELPISDPYAERMQAALRQIAVPSYPRGMILWLETADPQAYAELTSQIPDEIDRMWKERVPLEQFEAVLSRLVSVHWQCREACVRARTRSKRVPKTSQLDFGTSTGDGGAQ